MLLLHTGVGGLRKKGRYNPCHGILVMITVTSRDTSFTGSEIRLHFDIGHPHHHEHF